MFRHARLANNGEKTDYVQPPLVLGGGESERHGATARDAVGALEWTKDALTARVPKDSMETGGARLLLKGKGEIVVAKHRDCEGRMQHPRQALQPKGETNVSKHDNESRTADGKSE